MKSFVFCLVVPLLTIVAASSVAAASPPRHALRPPPHADRCAVDGCLAHTVSPETTVEPSPLAGGTIPPVTGPIVRIAYVIPSNRAPQPYGVTTLQHAVRSWHVYFQRHLQRHGFGPKSFRYETEADGITPLIHVVDVAPTDATLRQDLWTNVLNAATAAGVPLWTAGQVWFLVPEAHLQLPDSTILGGVALGASFGSGLDPGVAMLGSNALAMMSQDRLVDDALYHDQVVPEIGPFPLKNAVSFPWFEGDTFSGVASSALGAGMHELGHALGLAHDFRNDVNFHGPLMGNGLRGFRGSAFPDRYPDDDTHLGYGDALALSRSRYFLPAPIALETLKPALNIVTGTTASPVNGLLEVKFAASDAAGLALALLRRNGDTVGELPLSGTSATATMRTPYFTYATPTTYEVSVYDVNGNRSNASKAITVIEAGNVAPRAEFRVVSPTSHPGTPILLTAELSNDPDDSSAQTVVEWDLDGDGIYETPPTTQKTLWHTFDAVGTYQIGLRVTDPDGANSSASPIPLVVRVPGDFDDDGDVDGFDIASLLGAWGLVPAMPAFSPFDIGVVDVGAGELGDSSVDASDLATLLGSWVGSWK